MRTRVHEYGGGASLVDGGVVWFSHFADNRIYVIRDGGARCRADFQAACCAMPTSFWTARASASSPCAKTIPSAICSLSIRCARSTPTAARRCWSKAATFTPPRVSPDGSMVAWLSWDHPRMPWQGTELWVAELLADGTLGLPRLIAGGPAEAICQPEWSPANVLHFVSDRSGWWNLYRLNDNAIEALCDRAAEFGLPHWSFGGSMYGFLSAGEIVCTYIEHGVSRLAQLSTGSGKLHAIPNPYEEIRDLRVAKQGGRDAGRRAHHCAGTGAHRTGPGPPGHPGPVDRRCCPRQPICRSRKASPIRPPATAARTPSTTRPAMAAPKRRPAPSRR
ncbi:hypothetical protein LP420_21535 [Massilia sp. B-10]|nr:hypothetical protein LP420_21535 [Massilia sp. B-10]